MASFASAHKVASSPRGLKKIAPIFIICPLKHDDVFVITFPKTGTTLTQELVWLVGNDFDYEKAKTPLVMRFPFLEIFMIVNSERFRKKVEEDAKKDERVREMIKSMFTPGSKIVADLPSPRYIKSHLHLSLLPPSLLDTTKVVYVARDPRDVAVSYYYHNKLFLFNQYTGDFKQFWNHFLKGQVNFSPFFSHVLEAWQNRNHPHMLFLFYEDMMKDLPSAVLRVAKFLGKNVTEEQLSRICDHLSFENFKKNKSVNYEVMRDLGWLAEKGSFVRKGLSGGWRDYFDVEMRRQAEQWIEENLRGTELRFPQ